VLSQKITKAGAMTVSRFSGLSGANVRLVTDVRQSPLSLPLSLFSFPSPSFRKFIVRENGLVTS